ncbi:MAG: caspase family protein, partial [Anaerolineales bacterium]
MADRIALIIANYEFDDPKLSRLVSPSRDAQTLSGVLADAEIGGYQTITLINENHSSVSRHIARLYQKRRKDDLLLLYYSGHGIKDDDGDLYLAVKDTETDTLSATALEAYFITRRIDKCLSRRMVVILDCCYSGAFTSGGAKAMLGGSSGMKDILAGNGYGRVVLTASNSVQYAWEGEKLYGKARPSIFTQHLVSGLKSGAADLNRDGSITVDELYEYVYDRVISSRASRQTPQKWELKTEGQLVIAYSPYAMAVKPPLPAAPRLSVRLTYIPEQVEAGEDVRWSVSMTNNSREELSDLEVRYGDELLRAPFTIPPGRWRRVSFLANYPQAG